MKFFELAYRLGIIIAIFGFIWGVIRLILSLLRGGGVTSVREEYFLKIAKYMLLVNVVVLNDIDHGTNTLMFGETLMTGLILLMYFIGNIQKTKEKFEMTSILPNGVPFKTIYSATGETIALGIGVGAFAFFVLQPSFASYGLSRWFYDGVISIENTFIIGFVFKVIGFFFLVGIIQKMINSVFVLLSGKPLFTVRSSFQSRRKEDGDTKDDFDDFEEIK